MTRLRMRDFLIMTAAVLLTLGIAAAQFSGGPGGGRMGPALSAHQDGPGSDGPSFRRERGPFRALGILARYLELTEEQVEQIRALNQATREEARGIHEQIRSLREQLKAEFDSGNPDAAVVGGLMIQIHGFREEARALHTERNQQILDLLTPEQRDKVNEVLEAARLAPVVRALHELHLLPPPGGDALEAPPEE